LSSTGARRSPAGPGSRLASQARARARYAAGLPGFLRARVSPEDCRRTVRDQLAARSDSMLAIFGRAVYANPASPYRALLERAGIELGDVAAMLDDEGVEPTLERLSEAGVRLSIDEFKGRVPVVRDGLELRCEPGSFDNPLLSRHYEASTSGARTASRVAVDLDLLAHESAYLSLCVDAWGIRNRPFAAWRPVLPGLAGTKGMLRRAHLGLPSAAWFSQYRHPLRPSGLRFKLMTGGTVALSSMLGAGIPRPRHVPLERSDQIARWIAARCREGTPAHLDTNWSSAVRVCAAARDGGLDIAGTFFRVGGEPATPARRAMIEAAGGTFGAHYSMGEIGWIGIACPNRRSDDEVHVVSDKVALIQPARSENGSTGASPLVMTTVLTTCPKILINVDVGDHAIATERDCDCPMGRVGLRTTLRSIASQEKLTTEGMSFVASEIAWLLEEALPARIGGGVGDYQLVEDRSGSLSRISVVVDPAVPAPPDEEVGRIVLELFEGLGHGQRLMAEQWRQAGALSVSRRAPYVRGDKVQHLHVIAAGEGPQP
jgi:hypothetical protein